MYWYYHQADTASFSSVELYLKSNFLDDETFKEDERDSVGVMMDNGSL